MATQVGGVGFDYEAKRWGRTAVQPRPWYLQGLKLRYCLDDLRGIEGTIADVGCGAGNMAKAVKRLRPDLQVHGVDVSSAAVQAAQQDPQGVEFHLASADGLPFPDSSLNAVTMFDVLEHLARPEKVLAEVSRVLVPGGVFHLALPLEGQPWTIYPFLARLGWDAKRRHCGHIQAFSEASFRNLADTAGVPVTKVRWSFHPLFQLIDVAYFAQLDLLRRRAQTSVEEYASSRPGPLAGVMGLGAKAMASLGWAESRLFRHFRGSCGHFTCSRSLS
ncbi:MAG TPA: class I SAM-dependent methyltransferase [Candidatus Dormibacteraeota bacterium]|jgi:SAM-dependent methyltransferase|nr:class I SAM-dependent methyltransferase [Candidatus Dormibacteraeota bacterium]